MSAVALKKRIERLEIATKGKDEHYNNILVAFDNGNGVLYDSVTREPISDERIAKAKMIIQVSKEFSGRD